MRERLWSLAYPRWRKPAPLSAGGYAFLILTPPDLHCWLDLSLRVLDRQEKAGLREILVVPDAVLPRFERYVRGKARTRGGIALRLVRMKPRDRLVRRMLGSPSTIHFLQIVNAIESVASRAALLHDVDLFPLKPDFLCGIHRQMRHRLAACGIARPWSGYDWSGLPGTGHLVATWEMMVDVAWARSFSPSDLRPRADVIDGRRCVMDTFLYAQRRTSPGRIRCLDAGGSIVHFGHVVSRYRQFERSSRRIEDVGCILLLTRLLLDLFGHGDGPCALPSYAGFVRALEGRHRRLYYGADARRSYPGFRGKLKALIDYPYFEAEESAQLLRRLAPFDARLA